MSLSKSTTMTSPDTTLNQTRTGLNTSSFLSSTRVPADKKWAPLVRQKIFDLEGPNFSYKPLFSNPPASEVRYLILILQFTI